MVQDLAKKTPIEEDNLFEDNGESSEVDEEEFMDFEVETEVKKDYKFLKLDLVKGLNDNDHTLLVEGQTHGFCNALVKQLLTTEGVISAAYRVTVIKPSEIFIRLDDGFKINDILFQAIDSLRNEVETAQSVFKKLM